MPDHNLTPAISSFVIQLSWIGPLFIIILALLGFVLYKLILFILYVVYIITKLMAGGSLTSVLNLIMVDSFNVIYDLVSFLMNYLLYLLFHKGVGPHAKYQLVNMFCDYLFMMMFATYILILLIKSVNKPRNYINHIVLIFSILPFFNLVCLVFGGLPYLTLDFDSHLDNLCNIQHIVAKLLCSLYRRLNRFIKRRGGLVGSDLLFIRLDRYFEPVFTLFFSSSNIVSLITFFYGLLDIHYFTNVHSGYVYPDFDIS